MLFVVNVLSKTASGTLLYCFINNKAKTGEVRSDRVLLYRSLVYGAAMNSQEMRVELKLD